MAREIKTIVTDLTYAESPRWHDGRLWFVDFYTHQVLSVAEDGSDRRLEAEVPQQPSGLGWLPDGRLVVVSMRDATILRRETSGCLTIHAALSSYVGGLLNDMVLDAQGRAYVGNFGFDLMGGGSLEPTVLLLVQPEGDVSVEARDMWFPNGSIITPDGKTLIVAESMGNRISAFDIDHHSGALGERRDWASFGSPPTNADLTKAKLFYSPDGCCLDAEGCIWFADSSGARLVRMRPGGEVVEQIDTGAGVFACMLGGSDGRTLFACVAPDYFEHVRKTVKEASIVAIRVDVPRAGLP